MATINGIKLPISLPVSVGNNKTEAIKIISGIKLPIKLPISVGGCTKGSNSPKTTSPLLISIKEKGLSCNNISFPISEEAWDFKGLILEETIVDYKSQSFTLYEDVRSRILTEIHMIDKNHLYISWYGQSVSQVVIYRKSVLDNDYVTVATLPWDSDGYVIEIPEDATNIKLEGVNQTGESSVITLEDGFNTEVKTELDIAMNLKIHYLETNRNTIFKMKVNY